MVVRSIASQHAALKQFDERPGLVGPRMWVDALEADVGRALQADGLVLAKGDLVTTADGEIIRVAACGTSNSNLFVLGSVCDVSSRLTASSMRVKPRVSLQLVWIGLIVSTALCWELKDN